MYECCFNVSSVLQTFLEFIHSIDSMSQANQAKGFISWVGHPVSISHCYDVNQPYESQDTGQIICGLGML